ENVALQSQGGFGVELLVEGELGSAPSPPFPDSFDFAEFLFVAVHMNEPQCRGRREVEAWLGIRCTPFRALIDPSPQDPNLLGRERIAFARRRHFHVRNNPGYIMNKGTFSTVAGNDVHAVFSALQRRLTIIQAETAFRPLGSVATEATVFKNR